MVKIVKMVTHTTENDAQGTVARKSAKFVIMTENCNVVIDYFSKFSTLSKLIHIITYVKF